MSHEIRIAALIFLLLACLMTSIPCGASETVLSNAFIEVAVRGAGIVSLRTDPAGKSPSGVSFIKDLRPEFWYETPETRIEISGDRATVSPLEIWEYRPVSTPGRMSEPSLLRPGHTIAQTFAVGPNERFDWLQVYLPTWGRKTSSATLALYHDGKVIASKRLMRIPDNSWQSLNLKEAKGEGVYAIELSKPSGMIGWWSASSDMISSGEALEDGKPICADRAVQVHVRRLVGTGKLTYSLVRNALEVEAELHPQAESAYNTFPWRWRTTWTKGGYDCSPKAGVLFSRFFTDNQRYMPVQQLKRRDNGGLAFDGFHRIEMEGNERADLRLESGPMHLHWELRPNEMHLRFDTPIESSDGIVKTRFTLTVLPREDSVPSDFPRFTCSDKAVEADLNRLWWERGFTYPIPPNRSAEWIEWTELARCWFANVTEDEWVRHVAEYPMTSEGYDHTYGDIVGWPLVPNRDTRHFDTNARFILGVWRRWLWTGDTAFLKGQADRLRKAMDYQLDVLKGRDGLIVTPDFKTGRHEDLSDNYWDILPFGRLDAYANAVFYGSLLAMAEIEEALAGLTPSPLGGERRGQEGDRYRSLAALCHRRYDEVFWLPDKGRYAGCVDIDGVKHDYGFTFVNLEALFYGLGDTAKACRIYKWMETEPTSSGKADTYSKFIFAPRSTTIHNPQWKRGSVSQSTISHQPSTISPWWTYWWPGTPFGDQCQDGGAILYTSFFDLMDRVKHRGADNAWQRFTEILGRYRMPDRLCGGSPLCRGEVSQQENAGAVGTDYPFPESGLVPLYYLYGVIGAEATPDGLRITPRLPKSLSSAGVTGLRWHGMTLNIRVTRSSVEIKGKSSDGKPFIKVRSYAAGRSVLLPMPR